MPKGQDCHQIEHKGKLSNWKSDHQMDEAYKALRTNIQFCGADKKVIALTSCTPNEG